MVTLRTMFFCKNIVPRYFKDYEVFVIFPSPHLLSLSVYRVSQEECARLREDFPYVKVYRCNPKHLCPNLNGYGDNGQRSFKL